jgi:hypothetical protein
MLNLTPNNAVLNLAGGEVWHGRLVVMRCPQDFGLITLDDYPWLQLFNPPVTAVEIPKYQVGYAAAELLFDRIAGKTGKPVTHKISPRLYVRQSCGFGLRTQRLSQTSLALELAKS